MNVLLQRFQYTDNSTIGRIIIDDERQCYTLELPGTECIPPGTYPIVLYQSPTHGLVPLLQNVPGHSMIEIHPGNDEADTKGCILPGTTYSDDWVSNSREAFFALFHRIQTAIAGGEAVAITVE